MISSKPAGHEVGVLELRNRTQALHRGPDRHADDRLLRDRGVHHPLRPEAIDEPLRDLEGAAVDADVLAEHEHALVALHLFPERLRDRDQVGGLPVLAALAARLGAVAGRAGFDLLRRHQLGLRAAAAARLRVPVAVLDPPALRHVSGLGER